MACCNRACMHRTCIVLCIYASAICFGDDDCVTYCDLQYAGGILFFLFVRCVCPKTLLTRYLAECLTHFYQTYINDALWDRDERVTIWGQRSRSWWNKVCWKQQLLGLLTRCLGKVLVAFSPNLHQWCIMGQRWMRYIFGSKGQSSRSWWNVVEPSLHRQWHTVLDVSCQVSWTVIQSIVFVVCTSEVTGKRSMAGDQKQSKQVWYWLLTLCEAIPVVRR